MADLMRQFKELPKLSTPELKQYEEQEWARIREAIRWGLKPSGVDGSRFTLQGIWIAEQFHPNILERSLSISAEKKRRENLDEELAERGVVRFTGEEIWYELEALIGFPVPDGLLSDTERFERFHWVLRGSIG